MFGVSSFTVFLLEQPDNPAVAKRNSKQSKSDGQRMFMESNPLASKAAEAYYLGKKENLEDGLP